MDRRAKLHKTTPEAYGKLKRFDLKKKTFLQWHILRLVTWIIAFPAAKKHKLKIVRGEGADMKGPYILLCTHMAFLDFKVVTMAIFPKRANYVVAIDGFIDRENLLRFAGGILKRRVISDINMLQHIRRLLHKHKAIVNIYPEARYSQIGTPAFIPDSLGKLIRNLGVPVMMIRMHGNYLNSPVWNLRERGNPVEAEMWRLFSEEELRNLELTQINQRIREAFHYDEYAWQKEKGIRIDVPYRAEGLHRAIYHCPACGTEFAMDSEGIHLFCGHCGKKWEMTPLGEMKALVGETEFPHLPDWYAWQEEEVRKEVRNGTYRFEDEVRVESLVNHKGYYDLGTARIVHDADGFRMEGNPAYFPQPVIKKPISMYTCHIEYQYFNKGDCFELSTMEETWYLYPLKARNVVTKIQIATEEMYKLALERRKEGK